MTLMMYFVRPIIVGAPMDIAAKIGALVGENWALGMAIHFLIGSLLAPLIYAFVGYKLIPGPNILKGAIFGIGFWLVSMTMAMPMMGEGMFLSASGDGPKPLIAAFMVHLIYGIILGKAAGDLKPKPTSTNEHSV